MHHHISAFIIEKKGDICVETQGKSKTGEHSFRAPPCRRTNETEFAVTYNALHY